MNPIRSKERDTVIQALRAGVVPRSGQHLIQVGRIKEIGAMIQDIDRIADAGSSFRVVIGSYGAGKTFFLNLVRSIGMEKKLVTVHADLNPDRRLQAKNGQARSLYAELIKNMSTRTKPDGGALPGVVEKFVAQAKSDAKAASRNTDDVIRERLSSLTEMVGGYDFADVIAAYYRGFEQGDETLKANAVRWLRGEFATKSDARAALRVRSIIDDDAIYDQIKLLARFIRLAGYSGMLVCLDEMVNLYKLANTQARNANYEQVLRILNDSMQGAAEGLGFILGGTPEFLLDTRRGLYSYQALQSRLAENSYAGKLGIQDFSGPVIRLSALSNEEFYVLLQKLRHVFAFGDAAKYLIPDEGIQSFMAQASQKLGEEYFRTPRTTITAFMSLLAALEQSSTTSWKDLVDHVEVEKDTGGEADRASNDEDELAFFKL